jgi:trigger factor
MQVSVETVSKLGRRVTVEVPAEQFERAFVARLERLSKQVKIPGFRPGKVPAKVIEARYAGQLLEEAAGDVIQRTLSEAMGERKLRPAGGTRIEHKPFARGKDFQYTAEFEVYPEIQKMDLAGIEIERPVPDVSDVDIDRTLENLRKQRVTWKPVERAAQKDDRLVISFVGRIDDVAFDGGKADNYPVVLGSNTLLETMEQGLIGVNKGETRRIPVTFPEGLRNEKLAGKAAEFEITVNEIEEPVLPEINAEFAQGLGIAGGVEELRSSVRKNLEREANTRSQAIVRNTVFKKLLEANRIEVPQSLVDAEVQRLKRAAESMRQQAGAPETDDSFYTQRATSRVSLGLILSEIVHSRGLRADPSRVRARIEDMAKDYDQPQKFVEWYYQNPERLGEVESSILEERVVEELLATASVRDRTVGFVDLMKMDVSVD